MQAYLVYSDGQARSVVPMAEQWVRGPSWIESSFYSIDAKPEGTATSAMMRGPMLQALLEDRFNLRVHRETKETLGYALVVAKSGPVLEPTKEGSCTPVDLTQSPRPPLEAGQSPPCGASSAGRDGLLRARGWSMANLCRFLTLRLNRKVVDKTGVPGMFDIVLDLKMDSTLVNMGDESGVSTLDAAATFQDGLQKLGLRLELTKGAAEFIVIDHIERPSAN